VTAASANGAADADIDVVIPVYNAVDDLERCVESVLAYTVRVSALGVNSVQSPAPLRACVKLEPMVTSHCVSSVDVLGSVTSRWP